MKIGIRLQIFLVALVVIVVSVVAVDLYLTHGLDAELTGRVEEDLFVRLALIERPVRAAAAPATDRAVWDALADDLGQRARGRVTIIAGDGSVLGDSELDLKALARVGNHAHRPEVLEALAQQKGISMRASSTTGQRLLYVTMPFRSAGPTAGCLRLALPLTEVDNAIARLRRLVLLASALGLVVAVLVASFAAQWISRALRVLTVAARRMASGDLEARVPVERQHEVAELAGALNRLAGNLSSALEDLRKERDLLGGVLDSMREGVLLLDRDGRIVLANPALRHMLMLGADVTGKLPLEMVRSSELQRALDEVAATRDVVTAELDLGDLDPRRIMLRAAPFPSNGGALAVFIDVTELRRLEAIRRDFVANVSHELRTPVTAVRGAVETLLSSGPTGELATEFLGIIERNAERLQNLLEDLLDLARIESRELKLNIERLELAGVIEHALDLLRERAEHKLLELEMRLLEPELQVMADRRALEQILVNLLDNALKYCPAGSRVTVIPRAEGSVVKISVEDNGPGIEPRHLPRLFERFYRVDPGRSRELGGTGLGLAIVKHLAETMGGAVSVDSWPGRGSVFAVTLPRG